MTEGQGQQQSQTSQVHGNGQSQQGSQRGLVKGQGEGPGGSGQQIDFTPSTLTDLTPIKMLYDSGLCVIPIPPKTKKPRIEWKRFENVRPTWEETVNIYLEEEGAITENERVPGNTINTAIICGSCSCGFYCVEFDDETACVYVFVRFPELKLNETRTVKSGGKSIHLYFKAPPDSDLKSCSYHSAGFPAEFRGNGNIIIAPQSIHPSGRPYEFKNRLEIAVKSPKEIKVALALLAQEWKYVSKVLPKWEEGSRDQLTMGVSCFMRKKLGYDQERVEKIITAVCDIRRDEELQSRLAQVRREFSLDADETSMLHMGEDLLGELTMQLPKFPLKKRKAKKEEKITPGQLATDILRKYWFATMDDTEEVYVYEGGRYRPAGETLVKSEVEQEMPKQELEATNHFVKEVLGHIIRRTYQKREHFDASIDCLNLNNGLYHIQTGTFSPHSPDYLSIVQLPITYDPVASCPAIDKFLSEIVADPLTLIEIAAYILYRTKTLQYSFLLLGEGANGKSVYLNLLRTFLGPTNVASISLQELEERPFAKANLYGKLANLYADLPSKALVGSSTFKMLSSGDPITADVKHKIPISFLPYAKAIFSANKAPDVNDDTYAFWRRWVLVPFPHIFEGKADDRDLINKLTSPSELSGFLNRCLTALPLLLARGTFTGQESIDATRTRYIYSANPAKAFIEICIVMDSDHAIPKYILYEYFKKWCQAQKLAPVSEASFFRTCKRGLTPYQEEQGKARWVATTPLPERPRLIVGVRFADSHGDGFQMTCREGGDVGNVQRGLDEAFHEEKNP